MGRKILAFCLCPSTMVALYLCGLKLAVMTFAGLLNVISCFEGQKLKLDQSKATEDLLKRS